MEAIGLLRSGGTGAPFVVESQRAWLYASDDVLRAIATYRRRLLESADHLANLNDEETTAMKEAQDNIYLAIRKELSPKTAIGHGWAKQQWVDIGSAKEKVGEYLQRTGKMK